MIRQRLLECRRGACECAVWQPRGGRCNEQQQERGQTGHTKHSQQSPTSNQLVTQYHGPGGQKWPSGGTLTWVSPKRNKDAIARSDAMTNKCQARHAPCFLRPL